VQHYMHSMSACNVNIPVLRHSLSAAVQRHHRQLCLPDWGSQRFGQRPLALYHTLPAVLQRLRRTCRLHHLWLFDHCWHQLANPAVKCMVTANQHNSCSSLSQETADQASHGNVLQEHEHTQGKNCMLSACSKQHKQTAVGSASHFVSCIPVKLQQSPDCTMHWRHKHLGQAHQHRLLGKPGRHRQRQRQLGFHYSLHPDHQMHTHSAEQSH